MTATPLYVYKTRDLFIDVESFSSINLIKCGGYKYWDSDDAEIILFSYAYDDDPVQTIDLLGDCERVPQSVLDDITNPAVIKHAFNANFERLAIHAHYGIYCDPESWRCTMVLGMSLGLPGKLSQQAAVLKMPIQKKSDIGKDGIKYFCIPCKPTKKNGYRTRNLPHHDWAKWQGFKGYNVTDVEAERGLWKRLVKYDMQPRQWRAWAMDQRINDRGAMVDMQLVENAIWMNDAVKAKLIDEAARITGLSNPNSVQQLIKWLNDAEDEEDKIIAESEDAEESYRRITNLRKKTVIELLGSELAPASRRVLELRQMMAKASVSKYRAIQRSVCRDGRVRGLLQFYGAPRTGRWAGRIVQMQNLPQNHLKDLALCREIVKRGDLATLEMLFGEAVLIVLSELIRTAFIPAPGKRFIIADFSAIEGRLGAWDAQEEWRLQVFRTHGLIYEASASMMFSVPIELIKKGAAREDLRPKGKVSELALQYQGGPNALIAMGALEMGLQEDELLPIVRVWRTTSPNVRDGWYQTNDDAIDAIRYKQTIRRDRYGFEFKNNTLFQLLPSGRKLCYPNARLEYDERFGKDAIVFDGINQYTHQWGPIRTYGGKLFENRTQANGVDNLTNAMFALDEVPEIELVFSVHDEPVMEVPVDWMAEPYAPDHESKAERKKSKGVKLVEQIMCKPQPGFNGLPLAADGMDADFYQK